MSQSLTLSIPFDPTNNTTATILPASTPAAATDKPIVVALHPSSPLPPGTNVIGHIIVDSGAIVALITNDGTFAKESGGNLATIAGKDFATQATLALVAKDSSLTTIDNDIKANQPRTVNLITGFALDATVAKDTTLATIDTDIKATQPRSITNFPTVGSTQTIDGQTVAFSADWTERRILEATLIQDQLNVMETILANESYNSQRAGFEIR